RYPWWLIASGVALLLLAIAAALTIRTRLRSGAPPASAHRLAVLPFQNLKKDEASDFLGYSLADAVITKLDTVGDLRVRPSYSIAIKMLEQSVTLDANYTPSWANLGRAYTAMASFDLGGKEQYQKAQAAFEHALKLEPTDIESTVYLANFLSDTGRVEQAIPL